MTTQRWMDKKVMQVRSAIDGFDAKYKSLPIGEQTLVTVPWTTESAGKSVEHQKEVARSYVNKLLLTSLEEGIRVKYVSVGELSKERRKELENLQEQYPQLLVLGSPRGKSHAARILSVPRLLNKMKVVYGTDLILIDGLETQSRVQLKEAKVWVQNSFFNAPNSFKFFASICKCPLVVVQLEKHTNRALAGSVERIWHQSAELVLSLRHRGGLCLVAQNGTIRRGIEARLVKGPGGREEEDCWMV